MKDGKVRAAPAHLAVAADEYQRALGHPEQPAGAILSADALVAVRQQRKRQAVLLREALVRLESLRVDAEHVDTELLEAAEVVAVVAELPGADGRIVARVEDQQNALARYNISFEQWKVAPLMEESAKMSAVSP